MEKEEYQAFGKGELQTARMVCKHSITEMVWTETAVTLQEKKTLSS